MTSLAKLIKGSVKTLNNSIIETEIESRWSAII